MEIHSSCNDHFKSKSDLQISIQENSSKILYQRRRGILNLLSINALVCGVEIVSSCAFTYIPPLLLKSGFSEFFMTIILGVAPLIDMITVPVLAEWSDNSSLKFGRRRPIIICLSLILIISLALIPFSQRISLFIVGETNGTFHMFILALGVILLDYSYQAIFNPCEALLSDTMSTCDRKIQTLGFSIYSACLSLGCIIGYLIVCIKWTSLLSSELTQDQICFFIITVLLLPCLLLTLSNKEVPLQAVKKEYNSKSLSCDNSVPNRKCFHPSEITVNKEYFSYHIHRPLLLKDMISVFVKYLLHYISSPFAQIIIFVEGMFYFGLKILKEILLLPVGCYKRIRMSPVVIRRVFYIELFGWTALHCHDRFFTDFVGQYLYAGDPNAQVNTTEASLYDEGIQMGSWCLFLQSLAACLYAFFIQQHLVHLLGPRHVFLGGILVFLLSMVMTLILPSVSSLKVATALSGIGTATLTTTPNMLVTHYFQRKEVYMADLLEDENLSTQKERGLGTEVAVLDMAYYLSQVTLSFFLGPLVEIFRSSLMYIIVSTVMSFVAFYCAIRVVFTPQEFKLALEGKF